MASSRLLLNSPFFCVCVENYIFFFCQALPQRKRRYIFLSRCINPRVGRKNSPPPTPTEKRKKKPQPPHMLFCLDFSHGSGLQILWTIKHHITNKSKAYTHTHTSFFFVVKQRKEKHGKERKIKKGHSLRKPID